jgi:hypothetical protein
MLIETEKSDRCSKPHLIVADPLDVKNLDTLRRLRSTSQGWGQERKTG